MNEIDDHVLRGTPTSVPQRPPQRAMQRLQLDYPASGPWDSRQEEALKRLEAELRELQDRREVAVAELTVTAAQVLKAYETNGRPGVSPVDLLAHALLEHAEGLRDALAPFDSGVRNKAGG